ncbi:MULTISPECIES: acetylxylan esterase [unclassified Arthrobacter]|uniref:acetylxylan esterase n=1 Tax=unclassified Arthrobacter TaxID=235627 RepID=UPI001C85EA4B|nr:acetylxylan esterase [Arthrobacter sp. MAHUQ-56]MBX7444376.1 acetylxylan esterase [Arthrobacter sp. MAHUQ-56]
MPTADIPLEQLRSYKSAATEPEDFDRFWKDTLAEARTLPLAPLVTPVDNLLPVIDSYNVSFSGYGGARINGWLHLPARRARDRQLPAVVQYIGYSGGRGLVQQDTKWAQAGYAHFIMDTRGQGYGGITGDTPDPHPSAGGVAYPGLMTRGLGSKEDYYYRRLYVDAFRAIETVQNLPEVDPSNIILTGISQGGGLALAAAGLAAGRLDGIRAVLADVPFLQDFPRAINLAQRGPYPEITAFLARHRDRHEQTFAVLNYFDGVHLASRAIAPALYSVALLDDVCPPSTVFASYNSYGARSVSKLEKGSAKSIDVYPFSNHEGGQEHHWVRQLRYLNETLKGSR